MKFWTGALERYAEAVARESGRMLAVLASNDGARLKLDWLLDTVFVSMIDELAARGVPRRVVADMMGMSHRTLQRQYSAAVDSLDVRGRSVWTSVVETLRDEPMTREELTGRLTRVPPVMIASVVNNMIESEWIEENGDELHLVAELGRSWTDESLHAYIDVRRRAEPGVLIERVAEDLGLTVERLEPVWELSERVMIRAKGENAWMAMERAYSRTIRLLRETADAPDNSPHSATTWRVRLDDKPQEFRDELRDYIEKISVEIEDKVTAMRTHYDSQDDSRFWLFTAFQTYEE